MVKVALFVRLEAKPGKEKEVESFLVSGLPIVNEEPATTAWFGIRLGPSTFGIFDAFPDEAGRQAHLAQFLLGQAPDRGDLVGQPQRDLGRMGHGLQPRVFADEGGGVGDPHAGRRVAVRITSR